MGTYGKAGLAQGLSSGLMGMGSMLLDVQARQEQRAFREYQVKATAQERKDRKDEFEWRKWVDKEEFRQAGITSERAERKRQDEAAAKAIADAQERRFFNTGQGLYTSVGNEMPTVVSGTQPTLTPSRSAAPPDAPRITGIEGRSFPDTPQGRFEALEWQKLMQDAKQRNANRGGAGGGAPAGGRPLSLDDLTGGMDLGGVGESPITLPPEAPAPVRPRAFTGEPPAPVGLQLPGEQASRPSEEDRIKQLLAEGRTPEQIDSILTKEGY